MSGLEPLIFALSERCTNRLCYIPLFGNNFPRILTWNQGASAPGSMNLTCIINVLYNSFASGIPRFARHINDPNFISYSCHLFLPQFQNKVISYGAQSWDRTSQWRIFNPQCSPVHHLGIWCARMGSNHPSQMTADLQSAPLPSTDY